MEDTVQEREKNNFFLDKYFQLIIERDKAMLVLIQLIVALLVVASFSNNIISDICSIKVLITVFLFLTTLILIDYLFKLNNGLNAFAKATNDNSDKKKDVLKKILDGSVYLYALVIILIIDIIIDLIISNLLALSFAVLVQATIIVIYFLKRD